MRWWHMLALWWATRDPDPAPVAVYDVPEGGFTAFDLSGAAKQLDVPPVQLLLAIVMCSERARSPAIAAAYEAELRAMGHCILNRSLYPQTFGASIWAVVMAGKTRTGEPGGQFATSVAPQGELLTVLLQLAARVAADHARGERCQNVTNYHHHQGEEAARLNALWESRGYVQVRPPGTGTGDRPATFFAPGPTRARTMK